MASGGGGSWPVLTSGCARRAPARRMDRTPGPRKVGHQPSGYLRAVSSNAIREFWRKRADAGWVTSGDPSRTVLRYCAHKRLP